MIYPYIMNLSRSDKIDSWMILNDFGICLGVIGYKCNKILSGYSCSYRISGYLILAWVLSIDGVGWGLLVTPSTQTIIGSIMLPYFYKGPLKEPCP
jgi:hypothetical protein